MARSWRARSLGLFNLNGILLRAQAPMVALHLGKQQLFFFFNPLGRGLNALAPPRSWTYGNLGPSLPPFAGKKT
jgi:hypothetical protein